MQIIVLAREEFMKSKAIHSSKVLIGIIYDPQNHLSSQPSKTKKIVQDSINSMKRFHFILPRILLPQLPHLRRKQEKEKISISQDILTKKMLKIRRLVLYKLSRACLTILIMMMMEIRAHLNKNSEFQNSKRDKQVWLLDIIKVSSSQVKDQSYIRAW